MTYFIPDFGPKGARSPRFEETWEQAPDIDYTDKVPPWTKRGPKTTAWVGADPWEPDRLVRLAHFVRLHPNPSCLQQVYEKEGHLEVRLRAISTAFARAHQIDIARDCFTLWRSLDGCPYVDVLTKDGRHILREGDWADEFSG